MVIIAVELGRRVVLDRIRVPENVRVLDDAHVQALAGSIALQGMLVPVVPMMGSSSSPAFTASRPLSRSRRSAGRRPRRRDRGRRSRGREHHVMPMSA
jgi:hypothetical protein